MNKVLFLLVAIVFLTASEMAFAGTGEVGKVVSVEKIVSSVPGPQGFPEIYKIILMTDLGYSTWYHYPPENPILGKDLRIVYLLNFAMANKDLYDVYVNNIYESSGGTKYIAYCQLVRDVKPLQDKIAALEAKTSYLMKKINKCCQ